MASATYMRSATTGKMVEVDVVDGKIVEFPDRVRCPDCGEIVPDVFAHVACCPDTCFSCNDAPAGDGDLYCSACRTKIDEDGPSEPNYDGPSGDGGYRQNMIDAGRGHLL